MPGFNPVSLIHWWVPLTQPLCSSVDDENPRDPLPGVLRGGFVGTLSQPCPVSCAGRVRIQGEGSFPTLGRG